MLRTFVFRTLLAFILPFGAMAAQSGSVKKAEPAPAESSLPAPAKGDYVLVPQDLIRVTVFQQEDINKQGEVRLSQESSITLPLIERVDLKGLTARQAEALIQKRYAADYFVNPQVSVIVLEYYKRYVDVQGAVDKPGAILFPPEEGLSLTRALSLAGGLNRYADKKKVTLKRIAPDGTAENRTFNMDDLIKGESTDTVPLQPGDIVHVAERIL